MSTIIINDGSLADFLSDDGSVTGRALQQRMKRYCLFIQNRMTGVTVTFGETSGTDEIPDDVDPDEWASVSNLAGNSLDVICDGRRRL